MSKSIADIIAALPDGDGWGPPVTTETTLNGVPYAPFSKGDKLGRMADWTADGKDGRDGRGGRAQYNRNYRGTPSDRCHRRRLLEHTGTCQTRQSSTLLTSTSPSRPTDIRLCKRLPLRRTTSRARRSLLLRRLQRPRQRQVSIRPWSRLHTWRPWPAWWCPRRTGQPWHWTPTVQQPWWRPRWLRQSRWTE